MEYINLYKNNLYIEDLNKVNNLSLPWNQLNEKSVLISGATGLIGSFLVDVLMKRNEENDMNCTVYALSRNEEKAIKRFIKWNNNSFLKIISYDINKPLIYDELKNIDYILHLASNTHPFQYSTDPIGTITTNIIGLYNILKFSSKNNIKRLAFASSNEIYGENRGDTELFDELYCGYIDSNTLRAGYPESKRCGEALCQAYIKQKNLDIVIPRLTRSYGPTMLMTDTKAISQFIKKAISNEDIVLKSSGTQCFSYTYVSDAVSGLLTILLCGKNGEAYNISNENSDIMLKDLAKIIADFSNLKVIFELPDEIEKIGYSKATKARLNGNKLKNLGWKPFYDIQTGIERTISILKTILS